MPASTAPSGSFAPIGSARREISPESPLRPGDSFAPFSPESVGRSVGDRFEAIASRHADRVALRFRGESVTYRELRSRARALAHAILGRLGPANEPVALMHQKGAPQIASIFGALLAGKAYVPLPPSAPPGRNAEVLADCGARLLVADSENASAARALAGPDRVLLLDPAADAGGSDSPVGLAVSPDARAYILYTSGSTGRPKGVVETHRNLLHNIANYTNAAFLSPDDRMTLLGSCAFSGSLKDYYGALLNGATLCLFDVEADGLAALAGWMRREGITVWDSVPPLFRHFLATLTGDEAFPHLRIVRLGGETATRQDFEAVRRHVPADCVLLNGYGATETGTTLLYVAGAEADWEGPAVPVGYPVEGYEVLLLDEDGQEVAPGEVGEIVARGPYISPGYWQRPEQTSAAFRPDPDGGDRRLYFTGDVGIRRPDGCFFHAGRKDFQLRVRGFRVEAGDVEAALLAYPGAREAVVVSRADLSRERCLVGYVTLPPGTPEPSASAWRAFLKERLPSYAVPACIVVLDRLPYNSNGKVDRKALPAPPERGESSATFVAPQGTLEQQLARIWQETLGLPAVGARDDFFELGGDSLRAARMLVEVERAFGVRWSLGVLVGGATVSDLARRLRDRPETPKALVPLQPRGTRPRFFCVHGIGGEVVCYRHLARHLGDDQPFYGLQALPRAEGEPPLSSIEAMATAYLEDVRALQPEGPYFLGGYSMGGAVAYEMSQQLKRQGQTVAALIVIDQRRPNLDPAVAWKPGSLARVLGNVPAWLWYDFRRGGLSHLGTKSRRVLGRLWRAHRGGADAKPDVSDVFEVNRLPGRFRQLLQANYAALRAYRPRPWDGPFTLLRSRGQPLFRWHEPMLGWGGLVRGRVSYRVLPGAHDSILIDPHVSDLAREVADALTLARAGG
jgi:amino acid adenylation domain-containing protein